MHVIDCNEIKFNTSFRTIQSPSIYIYYRDLFMFHVFCKIRFLFQNISNGSFTTEGGAQIYKLKMQL